MRVFNYLILILGLLLLLNIAGIETSSKAALDSVGNLIEDPSSFSLSTLFELISSSIGLAIIGGIAIGLYFRSSPESFLLVGYASAILVFVADIVGIITDVRTGYCSVATASGCWAYYVILLLMGVLAMGYVHSVLSWWGGKS